MYRFNQKKEGGCDFATVFNGVVEMKVFPCDQFSLYKVNCEREIKDPFMSGTIIISACVTATVVTIIGLIFYYDVLHFRVSCKQ